MKRFLNGTDQENSKPQGGKGQIRKIRKKKKEIMEEIKQKRSFKYVEVPIFRVFSISREHPWAPPSCDPTSAEPTLVGTSSTT